MPVHPPRSSRPLTAGAAFDHQMEAYISGVLKAPASRRTMLGGTMAALGLGAIRPPRAGASTDPQPAIAPGSDGQEVTTFTFGLDGDIHGLEPAFAYDTATLPVVSQICEGLLAFDSSGALQPLLAERWDRPNLLTYRYTLRQGVTFHDGTTMTSADVLATIARVRDPDVASPVAWMYDAVASVEAPDARTVIMTLASPSALFRYVPAVSAGYVVSLAAIDQYGMELTRHPIGTGPYRFVAWQAGSEVVLEKFDDYWQAEKPYFDRVVFAIVPDGTTRTAGLKRGELDATAFVPDAHISTIQRLEHVTLQEIVSYSVYTIVMRNDHPPFDDPCVRAAISHALDVPSLITNIVGAGGIQASATTVPPTMPGSAAEALPSIAFDLEKARQLMADSAFPEGFATTLVVAPLEEWGAMAVYVQEALQEIGIAVSLEQRTWDDVITLYQTGDYEGMVFYNWAADFPDASAMLLPLFHSRNVPPQPNLSFYRNPEVDDLLNASETALDEATRWELLAQAQTLIAADQPMLWLEYPKQFWAMNVAITGYTVSPLWPWDCFTRDLQLA